MNQTGFFILFGVMDVDIADLHKHVNFDVRWPDWTPVGYEFESTIRVSSNEKTVIGDIPEGFGEFQFNPPEIVSRMIRNRDVPEEWIELKLERLPDNAMPMESSEAFESEDITVNDRPAQIVRFKTAMRFDLATRQSTTADVGTTLIKCVHDGILYTARKENISISEATLCKIVESWIIKCI